MSAQSLGTGGNGLPETFEKFAETRRCDSCGDRVDEEHWHDDTGQCVGCKYGGGRR